VRRGGRFQKRQELFPVSIFYSIKGLLSRAELPAFTYEQQQQKKTKSTHKRKEKPLFL
jgi:hypothetical protein